MANESYINALQRAIAEIHGCASEHMGSVFVTEDVADVVLWQGDVEVFQLLGHSRANRCFAWMRGRSGSLDPGRLFAVLATTMIYTPLDAVKFARLSESGGLIEQFSRLHAPGRAWQ